MTIVGRFDIDFLVWKVSFEERGEFKRSSDLVFQPNDPVGLGSNVHYRYDDIASPILGS